MRKLLLLLGLTLYIAPAFSQTFFEGFENTTGPEPLPSTDWTLGSGNWAVFDNGVGSINWDITSTASQVYQGNNAAYMSRDNVNIGNNNTSQEYLATPAITVPTNGILRFHSRTFVIGNQGTIFKIMVAVAPSPQNNPASYVLMQQFDENQISSTFNIYEEKVVDLSLFAGEQIYIAFVKSSTQIGSVPNQDRWFVDDVTVEGDDCVANGSCSQLLGLIAFIDSNNNGVRDIGENPFNGGNFVYQINDSGTNLYGAPYFGHYSILENNLTNSYDFNFNVNNNLSSYFTSSASYNNVIIPSSNSSNYLYFPIVQIQPFNDIGIFSSPFGIPPLAGNSYSVISYCGNYGTTNIDGSLTFTKDPNLTIIYVNLSGIINTPTGFTYNFTDLAPNTYITCLVQFSVPPIPTVSIDQLITNTFSAQAANDLDSTNNISSVTQAVVASYDPNDISESHGEKIVFNNFTANDYLYYTIQFENTGTADAQFIRVEDLLNTKLDESTFEMLDASHSVNTTRVGNRLTWHFYDINLPPTASHPDDSHGYIHYRIKPKPGYAIGDIIPNTASIYFDTNPAIVTNTFNTEFVTVLGNPSFSETTIGLYPNPANTHVQIIQQTNEKINTLLFYDVAGKVVKRISDVPNSQANIDISALAKGVYFVEITTENHLKLIKKLIIQ